MEEEVNMVIKVLRAAVLGCLTGVLVSCCGFGWYDFKAKKLNLKNLLITIIAGALVGLLAAGP